MWRQSAPEALIIQRRDPSRSPPESRDNPKGREIGVLGTESLLDSLIVAGVLKEVFRRNRPDEKNPGDFWGGGTSFPSGHAIQVWAIASLLDHEYKHKKIVAITAYSL